mmetsp:Transcript_21727/g.45370  ORF Transcript_21727/g.45370 Transcript_21727/m.45370 type:complete len:246 (-) Transcript_21727:261-998(-)
MIFQLFDNPAHCIIKPNRPKLLVAPRGCSSQDCLPIRTAIAPNCLGIFPSRDVWCLDPPAHTLTTVTISERVADIVRPVGNGRVQVEKEVFVASHRTLNEINRFCSNMLHVMRYFVPISSHPVTRHVMGVDSFAYIKTTISHTLLQLPVAQIVRPFTQVPLANHTCAITSALKYLGNVVACTIPPSWNTGPCCISQFDSRNCDFSYVIIEIPPAPPRTSAGVSTCNGTVARSSTHGRRCVCLLHL